MFNKYFSFFLILFLLPIFGFAQNCNLQIEGFVTDHDSEEPLELVNIYIAETQNGVLTDHNGIFRIPNLCPGEYHLTISHVGCEAAHLFLELTADTTIRIEMEHSINVIEDVVVEGSAHSGTTQSSKAISEQRILDNANKNISTLLESIAGVTTLRNGSGIAKPVIHGLFGNRITILNNGIAQSGQQWGNDHSPEIDALVASKIRVIKGVAALEYAGTNLGGLVMVEPAPIGREPHLHGKGTYFFESNGRGHGVNLQLKQYTSRLAWKINGTIKKRGDQRAPNYFLNNTGSQEFNLALQLEKAFSKKFYTSLYFSSFNTQLGILRGSQIGNAGNLLGAFNRDVPFNTDEFFSYGLEAPRQNVNHQFLKLTGKYFFTDHQWFETVVAGQLNVRQEFDVRRNGFSDVPSLNLNQYDIQASGKYHHRFSSSLDLITGIQYNFIDNTNDPDTGTFPLIPDYVSNKVGTFLRLTKQIKKNRWELGARYDFENQSVATITREPNPMIERFENNFNNVSATAGWTYLFKPTLRLTGNIGLATRNPAINELFSNGLHQGVSAVEIGSTDLNNERSLKTTVSLSGSEHDKFSFEILGYYQRIDDYIFLNIQDSIETIRGEFLLFGYEQTDASIYGFDLSGEWQILPSFHAKSSYSFIRGNDLTNELPLVNIPANRISFSLAYEVPKQVKLNKIIFENIVFEIENKYVFRQNNLEPEQDFVLPPDAYYLLSGSIASDIQLAKLRLRFFSKIENALNTTYRDYLNRLRYFSDDVGVNFKTGLTVRF